LTKAREADFGDRMSRPPFRHVWPLLISAALFLIAAPAWAQTKAAWVQLTGQGAEARAVVDGDDCPRARVDGRAMPMVRRGAPKVDFPTVCGLLLPARTKTVTLDDQVLPLPGGTPKRVVIIGDTGCVILGSATQSCNDPKLWPFAALSRLAAAKKPDLVIHVGDYYYREEPCPQGKSGCAGSPYGDHWDTWAAEFFNPAAPLLAAAPWVLARGNHETCSRGGRGWNTLLDSAPAVDGCPILSPPFIAKVGDLNLFVLDSADAPDRLPDKYAVAAVASQLDRLGPALDQGQGWLVTHRPVWGLVPVARAGPIGPVQIPINATLQNALKGRSLNGVQMVVSGHIHHFSAISFGAARPAQLIAGTGGDPGLFADTPRAYGGRTVVEGLDATSFSFFRFGYYLMERDGEDWTGTFHDADDVVRAVCRLRDRALTCKTP
jgi:hypothetical protein